MIILATNDEICHKIQSRVNLGFTTASNQNEGLVRMTDSPYTSIIWLTQGKYTIVDNKYFDYLSQWKWHYTSHGYASRTQWALKRSGGKRKNVYLHRQLFILPSKLFVDHINGNTLDNRIQNLRLCRNQENVRSNRLQKRSSTGYKGVTFDKVRQRYRAQITCNLVVINLGRYDTSQLAAEVYDAKATELFGEFALTNKMLGLL